ncbi:DUF4355 domain-containing protein [Streptococcus dysgalactiae]|uniref:DUF4355 domain-containing protein n=1 Tax=Streptococcus dysgalactiae TaxID=1334 RepID=UPI00232B667A|nr:DUF4355 domain-containing protein [Streptococcus dysgalactiae]WCE85985.1 DUF4355 domain-containing protein [Streptococcus dysgalactiae]WCN25980.1 DUF4355 domain-containing protein [Streptococcus dysgalactiae]
MNENEELLDKSGAQEETKKPTFDDILSDPKKQAEFDKRVAKAIDTARNKWVAETEEKENEAKRLAKMNAEQKAQHEKDQLLKELAELKAERTRSEMTATARGMFNEASLSINEDLINQLVADNADDTKKAVEGFIDLFNENLEKAINERLKSPLPKTSKGNNSLTKADIFAVKDTNERQRLISENLHLFN